MSNRTAMLGVLCFGIVMFLAGLGLSQVGAFGIMSRNALFILSCFQWFFLVLQFAFFFLVRDKQ